MVLCSPFSFHLLAVLLIENFAWEDQGRKQCYIVHIATQGVNSAILCVHRTGYAYGKEPESYQKVFSALSVLDKTVSIRTKPVLSRFDVIYHQSRKLGMFNGGE